MISERDVQFVAVCDVRKSRHEAIKSMVDARYGTKDFATYSDIRQFLAEQTDVEAVLIATGDRWQRRPPSGDAPGKDVFCEKPSCHTMAQGRLVVETARTAAASTRPEPNGSARRITFLPSKWPVPAASARSTRPMPISAGETGSATTACRRNRSRPRMNWTGMPGSAPVLGGLTTADMSTAAGGITFMISPPMLPCGGAPAGGGLPGLDMSHVTSIDFEYSSPDGPMVTRLSNGVKLVLARGGDCNYWHGSCGERFDGPEGWVAAADGYSQPDVSSPALLTDFGKVLGQYTARTQRPLHHVRDFLDCVRSRRRRWLVPRSCTIP